jgi:hypothetical protein
MLRQRRELDPNADDHALTEQEFLVQIAVVLGLLCVLLVLPLVRRRAGALGGPYRIHRCLTACTSHHRLPALGCLQRAR